MRVPRLLVASLALATTACAHGPGSAQRFWPGEGRCYRDGGSGCHEAGWAALRGSGAAPDDRAAAAFFMLGCEGGNGDACADLGALYAAGRGVRRDDGRACELGLAEACGRAGRPAPAVAREPTAVLPPPGPAAAPESASSDAERIATALEYARYFVDSELHEPLALTPAALVADPPAPQRDLQDIRTLTALRRKDPERCLPVIRRERGEGTPAPAGEEGAPPSEPERVPTAAWATFVLAADGRTEDVRAVVASTAAEAPAWRRCVEEAIARWEFPLPRAGGRMWLRLEGNGPEILLSGRSVPRAGDPADAAKGFVKPVLKEPGCVARSIRVPELYAVRSSPFVVKFAVYPDGSVRRFQVVTAGDVSIPVARAAFEAVHRCEWIPGRGPGGAETAIWVLLPIRPRAGERGRLGLATRRRTASSSTRIAPPCRRP